MADPSVATALDESKTKTSANDAESVYMNRCAGTASAIRKNPQKGIGITRAFSSPLRHQKESEDDAGSIAAPDLSSLANC